MYNKRTNEGGSRETSGREYNIPKSTSEGGPGDVDAKDVARIFTYKRLGSNFGERYKTVM